MQEIQKRSSAISKAAILAGAFGVLLPSAALADERAASLEEIVVTASKRGYAESLQVVPMSIQALLERTLEKAGVRDFEDFARMAPSVTIAGTETGTPRVAIRGVRTSTFSVKSTQENPLTSIYYDDIPVSMANFNPNLDLFDIQRIEVLRGPQGTLYGAGAMGGNIRFVTNKPDLDGFEVKAEGTLATTRRGGETYDVKGLVNIPVVADKFALRITGTSHWDDGYINNPYLGIKDFDDSTRKGARVAALIQPTEALSVTANLIYQDTNYDHGRTFLIGLPGEEPNLQNPEVNLYGNLPFADEMKIANLVVEYGFDWATIYSSTSYFDRDMTDSTLAQHLVEAVFGLALDSPNHSLWNSSDFIQEFRLTSAGDKRLNWIVGAFYSKRKVRHEQDLTFENAEDVFGFPTGGFGAPDDDMLFYGNTFLKQKQYAVFGEAIYKITDKLQATAGLRWSKYEQLYDLFYSGLFQGQIDSVLDRASADKFTPKVSLAYHADDDLMVYASAAQGYRLGGVNEPVSPSLCAADLNAIGLTEAPATFASDSLWTYELGAKSQWFDHRMTLNAAAFYIDWKDIQSFKSLPQCGQNFRENAGKLESKGFEVELMARPAPGLTLTAATTYTDAALAEDVPNLLALKGDRTPYVPKWSASAAVEYYHPITDSLNGYVRFDIQHVGQRFSQFGKNNGIVMPSYELANIHVGIDREAWEVALFVKNIWDKRALTGADNALNVTTYNIERPRTIGVTLRARY